MAVQRDQPYSGFNFLVEVDAIGEMHFSEVSGLGAEISTHEYRNGSDRENLTRKVPGLTRYSPVVLRRGITGDLAVWEWFTNTAKGDLQRASVSITLLNENREEVLRFNLSRAWPSKWEGPTLHANSNEVAIEELELTHERLELE